MHMDLYDTVKGLFLAAIKAILLNHEPNTWDELVATVSQVTLEGLLRVQCDRETLDLLGQWQQMVIGTWAGYTPAVHIKPGAVPIPTAIPSNIPTAIPADPPADPSARHTTAAATVWETDTHSSATANAGKSVSEASKHAAPTEHIT
ncbi:hypothetical protein FRB95_005756 [Tulasnella sp. JGI-2019a]|nr:hypothetical protein FRB95_005756 [Tulasnella sp. JGI-2019a]